MINRIMLFTAAGSLALITSASALPLNRLSPESSIVQARTVCNDDGECWHETNPAEDITRGVVGGFEGRSIHRDRDRDQDRSGPRYGHEENRRDDR